MSNFDSTSLTELEKEEDEEDEDDDNDRDNLEMSAPVAQDKVNYFTYLLVCRFPIYIVDMLQLKTSYHLRTLTHMHVHTQLLLLLLLLICYNNNQMHHMSKQVYRSEVVGAGE